VYVVFFDNFQPETVFVALLLKFEKLRSLFAIPLLFRVSATLQLCFSIITFSFGGSSHILKSFSLLLFPTRSLFTKSFLHLFSPFPILFLLPSLLFATFLFALQTTFFCHLPFSGLSSDAFWIEHLSDACNGDVFSIRWNRIDFIRPDFVPRLRSVYLPSVVCVDDFKDADDIAS
jgi:hypothetical protein